MADRVRHMCPGEQSWQLHTWNEHSHPPFDGESWNHQFDPIDEPVERDARGNVLMPDELMERVGRSRSWTRKCDKPVSGLS